MDRCNVLRMGLISVLLLARPGWFGPQGVAAEPSFQELLKQTLPGMGAPEIADRQDSQQRFQAACYAVGAPGREAERAEACQLIVEHLGPQTAKPARLWLLKQLEVLGKEECVAALAAQLGDHDPEIADAARRALENNPAPEANAALLKALRTAPAAPSGATGGLRPAQPSRLPTSAKRAAIINSLRSGGSTAVVLEMLASDDAERRILAAGYLNNVRGPEATKVIAAELPKLSPAGQVLLLGALAARGDKAAGPAALAAAKSENPQIKLAALRSLATLGDASAVPLLIEALAAEGEAGSAAKESLRQVWGHGADEALVEAMQKAEPPLRDTLLDVLEYRGCTLAVPALLALSQGQDAKLRARVMRALGKLAEPEHVPLMIKALLSSNRGAERDDAEKAIMFACGRSEEETSKADPVLAALAEANETQRLLLLPLLGRIGGPKALLAIEAALKSPSADLREAGLRGLCNWPDASVADELLRLAESSENPAHRTWALRAYIRVIGLQSKRSGKQSLVMFQKAMDMVTRDEERKLVLSRVSEVRDVAALRWLMPYLDNPALATEASRAVVDLARRRELMGPHRAECMAALKKVSDVCRDQRVVEQAQRTMTGL